MTIAYRAHAAPVVQCGACFTDPPFLPPASVLYSESPYGYVAFSNLTGTNDAWLRGQNPCVATRYGRQRNAFLPGGYGSSQTVGFASFLGMIRP